MSHKIATGTAAALIVVSGGFAGYSLHHQEDQNNQAVAQAQAQVAATNKKLVEYQHDRDQLPKVQTENAQLKKISHDACTFAAGVVAKAPKVYKLPAGC